MRRRMMLAGVGGVAALLAGCTTAEEDDSDREQGQAGGGGGGNSTTADADTATDTPEQQVKLLEHEFYKEDYSAGVKGILQNVSGQELAYVEVKVYFLDSEGTQIGDSMDNTTELAADRKWKFDAMYLGDNPDDVDSYEIETEVNNY